MDRVAVRRSAFVVVAVALAVGLVSAWGAAAAGEPAAVAASGWSIQSIPKPQGANDSELNGVSCTSASACIAVGASTASGKEVTLAERWNGKRWSILSTLNESSPFLQFQQLNSVACVSPTACTAVGSVGVNGDAIGPPPSMDTLIERWNGRRWSIQTTPRVAKASFTELSSVSCPSKTTCTAVGSAEIHPAPPQQVVERWNGKRWAIQHAPSAHNSSWPIGPGGWADVSCSASTSCTAVSGGAAMRWDGTHWAIRYTLSDPREAMLAVSCPSARACTAVGFYLAPIHRRDGDQLTFATGIGFTISNAQPQPIPDGTQGEASVSCTSRSACTAVWGGGPAVERWNGSRWVIQRTPGLGSLVAVSCESAIDCTAVGSYVDAQGQLAPRVERWNR